MSKMANYVLNNDKLAVTFDKNHGTSISQSYDFPFNLTADEIWERFVKCNLRTYLPEEPKNVMDGYCSVWDNIINALDESHFPYSGVKTLSSDIKSDILCGMASHFNFDDVVYFSIEGIQKSMNKDVDNEIISTVPDVYRDAQWVISPKTLNKIQNQLLGDKEKLSMFDIAKEIE